jgi:very-short-patch-repair endonuclease
MEETEQGKNGMHLGAKPVIFGFAKELRERETRSEQMLWEVLRDKKFMNLKFRRQHPISKYIADFYNHELKIVIELDGKIHDEQEQIKYDIERDNYLKSQNIKVIRIRNEQIMLNMEEVLNTLETICEELKGNI